MSNVSTSREDAIHHMVNEIMNHLLVSHGITSDAYKKIEALAIKIYNGELKTIGAKTK